MFGIWMFDWMIGKRDRAIEARAKAREARRHKINVLTGFFNQWARSKRHKALINRMTNRRNDITKQTIVSAWKFLIDFEKALEHKLNFFGHKHNRNYKLDALARWLAAVERSRSQKGLVFRTHRYHRNRRLAAAMEDWSSAARLQHKLRLLEICEHESTDPLDLAQAMEHVVEGIVMRQHVRSHELQVAHALRGRIADLKLQASVSMLEATLAKKVDKPTAEMIQRRGLRNWEPIATAQGTQKTQSPTKGAGTDSPQAAAPPKQAAAPAAAPTPDGAAHPEDPPVAGTAAGLPHSSHRMLLEQQYREHAARHIAAQAQVSVNDRYMRQAAFDAAHAVPPPHVADMGTEAAARASQFIAAANMIPDPAERQRRLDELNALTENHAQVMVQGDAARHHEHMMQMNMHEMEMRDAGLLGGVPPPTMSPGHPADVPPAPGSPEESALQRAREQVNNLRSTLQSESRRAP